MTVHHPVVVRYQPGASQRVGVAAAAAEGDKQGRYSLDGGSRVAASSVETWASLGESAEDLLALLTQTAMLRAGKRGQDLVAGSFFLRGRPMLHGCLWRSVAAALLQCSRQGMVEQGSDIEDECAERKPRSVSSLCKLKYFIEVIALGGGRNKQQW